MPLKNFLKSLERTSETLKKIRSFFLREVEYTVSTERSAFNGTRNHSHY